jgi:hypothetical protein
MNRVRIVNYLVNSGFITKNYDPLTPLEDNIIVSKEDLIKSLEPQCVSKTRLAELDNITLRGFITLMLARGLKIQLDPNDYPNKLGIVIKHDSYMDDLNLGTLTLDKTYVDWENSYESYNIKLTSAGIKKVYEKLPYTRLYDDLEFGIA